MNFPLYFAAAAVFGTDVGTYFDLPSANAAVPVAKGGANVVKGVLEFPNTGASSAQIHFRLPDDWTGIISAKIMWSSDAVVGDMKWNLATSFTDTSNVNDPDDNAFNTADTVTQTVPSNANDEIEASIASITTTGAVAGGICNIKISRDSADGSDTIADSVFLTGLEIVLRRLV